MGTKLYVGNLNYNTTEASLREAFGANGREVTSVSIIMDRETGRPRGFAFVEMATPEGAQQALQELDGQNLEGRMLRINEAREREPRGAGGPRSFGPRPGSDGGAGGYGGPPRTGGFGGPPGGPTGGPPGGPPGGGYAGGGGTGGFGARPPGPPGGFAPRPPGANFGPPAPPGGSDARRRKKDGDRDRDKGAADRGKKARKRGIDDGDW